MGSFITVLCVCLLTPASMTAPEDDVVLAASSLKPGDEAPVFTLPAADGTMVSLEALLEDGPVVLFFYRGAWCPFCTQAHQQMAEALPEIRQLGATVVTISPQIQQYAGGNEETGGLPYIALSDEGLAVAAQFGLDFALDDETQQLYQNYGIDLNEYNGSGGWQLNIPGYYVIDTNGIIAWAYANEDYKVRPSPDLIIEALKNLQ